MRTKPSKGAVQGTGEVTKPSTFGLDLERAVLGGLLPAERFPPEARRLSEENVSGNLRLLARAVLAVGRRVGVCDPVAVAEELSRHGGGIDATVEVARLAEAVPSPVHLVPHIELLGEKAAINKHGSQGQAIATMVKEDLLSRGFFLNTRIAFFYYLDELKKLFELNKEKIECLSLIGDSYGLNPQEPEFAYVLHDLQIETHARGQKCEVHRLAFYDRERRALYVSRFNGQMYRLNGENVDLLPNGADGVFFLDGADWEPFNYLGRERAPSGLLHRLLIEPINFAGETLGVQEQRLLFGLWIFALFFESLHPTKPLLVLLGPKGSGKTITLRKLLKLLFGCEAEVFGIEKEREDGFIAAVTSNYVAAFDNFDARIRWLNDHLARLATGQKIPRRRLCTTNESVHYPARCFIALTARTPQLRRDDVVDRLLLFHVDRYEQFVPEERLIREVLHHRDALWTELLEDLNALVKLKKEDPQEFASTFRLGDFAAFAWCVAQERGDEVLTALKKMAEEQSGYLLEEDPLLSCLTLWLENPSNHGRWVEAGTLFKELRPLAGEWCGTISPPSV